MGDELVSMVGEAVESFNEAVGAPKVAELRLGEPVLELSRTKYGVKLVCDESESETISTV